MISLSASGLWRAERCPGFPVLPHIQRSHADAEAGTEAHAEHEAACPEGWEAEVAFAYNPASGVARRLPKGAHRDYSSLQPAEIPGTADRVRLALPVVAVADYKSGFGYMVPPPRDNPQLLHNALSAASVAGADRATIAIDRPDAPGVAVELDAFDLAAARERLRSIWRAVEIEAARPEGPRVVAGDHCWRCPAMPRCPAHTAMLAAIGAGQAEAVLAPPEWTPEAVAKIWPLRGLARRALAMLDASLEAAVASMGPVLLGDGRVLEMRAGSRESIDGRVAYATLRDMHGEAVAKAAVEMETSKAAIDRALAAVAKRGQKAAMVRDALEAIRALNGAATKATKPKLEAVKIDQPNAPALPAANEEAA